jgi:hypothetical protein
LGLIIDDQLNWEGQIDHLEAKLNLSFLEEINKLNSTVEKAC